MTGSPHPIRCIIASPRPIGSGAGANGATAWSAAAARPRPPRPVPELFYTQPPIPDPMHSAPLSGSVRIRIAMPQPVQLPPGSLLVTALELTLDGQPPEIVAVAPADLEIDLTRPGPALARCGTGQVR